MRLVKKFSEMFKQNKLLGFILAYGIFYILAFFWLESRDVRINIVHSKWDDMIPFCEYFVVPYFSWFVYIAFAIVYFLFMCKEQKESKRFVYTFCTGMTVFLLVSYIYPNGHNLRPEIVGNNIFMMAVRFLHWIDTPTNILPSMHVFVTVACTIALLRQQSLYKRKGFRLGIWIWCILIILSTLFLKQHSIIDVCLALFLNVFCYVIFYKCLYNREFKLEKNKQKRMRKMRRLISE